MNKGAWQATGGLISQACMSLIISNVLHLFKYPFFLSHMSKLYLLKLASWKSALFWILWLSTPGHLLRANVIYSFASLWILSAYKRHARGFPSGSDGKESACNTEDPGSILGLGRSPGERNGYSIQYFFLDNSMDRGAWRATVHGVAKSPMWLSN